MRDFFELPPFLLADIVVGPVTFPFSPWELTIEFVVPALGVLVGLHLVALVVRRTLKRMELAEETHRRVTHWVKRARRVALAVTVVGLGSRLLGAEVVRWTGVLLRILNSPFYTSGSTEVSL